MPESIPAFGEGFERNARTHREELEEAAAKFLREQEPERWSDYESPARIRRERRRNREEDTR